MSLCPKVKGKVLGFRVWKLEGYKLKSIVVEAHWQIGVNEARCCPDTVFGQVGAHVAPDPLCDCGLYAFHAPPPTRVTQNGIVGAVLAWGRIEVHRDGFRAQYAEPVMLAYSPEQPYRLVMDLRAIAGEMEVELVEERELAQAAAKFGEPIAQELRPAVPAVPADPYGMPLPPGLITPPHYFISGGGMIGASSVFAAPVGTPYLMPRGPRYSTSPSVLPPPARKRPWKFGVAANGSAALFNYCWFALHGHWLSLAAAAFSTVVMGLLASPAWRRPKS